MKLPSLFLGGCLLCSAAAAQSANPASFAVAGAHSGTAKVSCGAKVLPGGRQQIRNASLPGLIRIAWGVDTEIV